MVTGALGITSLTTGSQVVNYTRDPSGTILSSHYPGGGNVINYTTDPYGNVITFNDPAGNTAAAYKYAPYGATTPIGPFASLNPFRWIGGYQNTTSTGQGGSYKLGARYYDTHAHFTQPDPTNPVGAVRFPPERRGISYKE